jgi:predicted nucleotidyltransferase
MAGKTDVVRCGHNTWWNRAADSTSGIAGGMYRGFIMATREQLLKLLREQYPYLAAEYGIKRIGIFGSYAKGEPEETSDVDILVEFERPIGFKFVELVEYLERLSGRRVDVLTPAGLQGIRVTRVAQDIAENIVYV